MTSTNPIGIFDSGVGGLTICQSVRELLPAENILYFADFQYAPYGIKSKQFLDERTEAIANFFISQQCKAIVVACNTATVSSISHLRANFSVPIIGVEPGVKPAALATKSGTVAILATEQTLKSDSFNRLKARYSSQATIEVQPCPEFVELVENLEHEGEKAIAAAERYIRPLLDKGCDQIVLGCTHFAFLREAIDTVINGRAAVIDTAVPVASHLKRRLANHNLLNPSDTTGTTTFWSSHVSAKIQHKISTLWQAKSVVYQAV